MKKLIIVCAVLLLASPALATYYTGNSDYTNPYTTDAYTMGLWHLDQDYGDTILVDASGNGNDGTIDVGDVNQYDPTKCWVSSITGFDTMLTTRTGSWGRALFPQSEENQTLASGGGDLTIEFWVNWDFGRPWGTRFFSKHTGGDYKLEGGSDEKLFFTQWAGGWQTTTTTYAIPEDQWVHVAVVVDRTSGDTATDIIRFFFNGVEHDFYEVAHGGGGAGSNDLHALGASDRDDYQFFGDIDEIRISSVCRYIPEPTTFVMFAIAFVALLRRKK
jgi:hypothetical protein